MALELTLFLKGQTTPERIYVRPYINETKLKRFFLALYHANTLHDQQKIINTFDEIIPLISASEKRAYMLFKDGSNVVKCFENIDEDNVTDRRKWFKTKEIYLNVSFSHIHERLREDDISSSQTVMFKSRSVEMRKLMMTPKIKGMIFPMDKYDLVLIGDNYPFLRGIQYAFPNMTSLKYFYKDSQYYIFPVIITQEENNTVSMRMTDDTKNCQGAIVINNNYVSQFYSSKITKKKIKEIAATVAANIISDFNLAMRGNMYEIVIHDKDSNEYPYLVCADNAKDFIDKLSPQLIGVDDTIDLMIQEVTEYFFTK